MPNMSYCRFENTVGALIDCNDAAERALNDGLTLKQFVESLSSRYEKDSVAALAQACTEFLDIYEALLEAEQNAPEHGDTEEGGVDL